MKKIVVGGMLGICLILGMAFYSCKLKTIEPETTLKMDDLHASANQAGYSASNLDVSIISGENIGGAEHLEFMLKNESKKKWYWRRKIDFGKENGGYEATDLEVKIGGIWYDVPLTEDKTNLVTELVEWHLLPSSTIPISVWTGIYQTITPGTYRFTVTIYDNNLSEFNLSCEFVITEEK